MCLHFEHRPDLDCKAKEIRENIINLLKGCNLGNLDKSRLFLLKDGLNHYQSELNDMKEDFLNLKSRYEESLKFKHIDFLYKPQRHTMRNLEESLFKFAPFKSSFTEDDFYPEDIYGNKEYEKVIMNKEVELQEMEEYLCKPLIEINLDPSKKDVKEYSTCLLKTRERKVCSYPEIAFSYMLQREEYALIPLSSSENSSEKMEAISSLPLRSSPAQPSPSVAPF